LLAAFILAAPARADEVASHGRFWIDAEMLGGKVTDAPESTP
jgi:hypothetical protein